MMKNDKCVNCKTQPVVTEQDDYYKYVIKHTSSCYPTFMLEAHHHTKAECIKAWNKFNSDNKRK